MSNWPSLNELLEELNADNRDGLFSGCVKDGDIRRARLQDLLLLLLTDCSRLLAGCALAWPQETIQAIKKLGVTPGMLQDEQARDFITRLMEQEENLSDETPLSIAEKQLSFVLWLTNVREDPESIARRLKRYGITLFTITEIQGKIL